MGSRLKSEWVFSFNASIASYLDASLLVSTGIVLANWQREFGFNAWWVGIISTVVTLSVGIGSIFGGYLADRFGRSKVFNLDILFTAIGTLIVAFSINLEMLLIGLIIAGIASGADLPTSLAMISERTNPERYGKVIASTELFWLAGIIISQGLGFLVANLGYFGTQVLFIWLSVVALSTWSIRMFSTKFRKLEKEIIVPLTKSNDTVEPEKISLRKIMTMKRYSMPMIGLIGFYLFWNIPANTWGSFLNYFLNTVGGRSQQFATLTAFFANILGGLVLYWIGMKTSDTRFRYMVMRIGLLLCILAFVVSAIYGGIWYVFTVAYFVYCMANMLHGEALYKIWSQQLYPVNMRASVTGLTYGIVRAVTAAFSFITPFIMTRSPTLLILILAFSLVLCWICGEFVIKFIKNNKLKDPVFDYENEKNN